MSKKLREKVREFRTGRGMSQAEMAIYLSISQPEYSRLETGTKKIREAMLKTLIEVGIVHESFMDVPEMIKDVAVDLPMEDQEMLLQMARRLFK